MSSEIASGKKQNILEAIAEMGSTHPNVTQTIQTTRGLFFTTSGEDLKAEIIKDLSGVSIEGLRTFHKQLLRVVKTDPDKDISQYS